jgi:phenylacetate-CoA ligase
MYSIVPDVFGAPLLDRYGCTEIGQVSAQCPVSTRHHVSMENVYLEVLDDNDNPVEPGGLGRVVVTGLYNYSMPFIRYDLGDYVILSAEPCACGRKLTAIDRIVGRTRSLFRFADGSIKFPYIKLVEIMPLLPHRQLQIAQTHPDRIEIRYVPEPGDRAIDPDGLMRLIRRRMHDSLRVDLKEMNEIPRAPSGKFFDYVCELEQ